MVVPGVHLAAVGSSAPAVDQIAKHLAETLPKPKQNLNINIFFHFVVFQEDRQTILNVLLHYLTM